MERKRKPRRAVGCGAKLRKNDGIDGRGDDDGGGRVWSVGEEEEEESQRKRWMVDEEAKRRVVKSHARSRWSCCCWMDGVGWG